MKTKKWLTYTFGVLLTLVVLAAVGGAGFRIGMMQNTSLARPAFPPGFARAPRAIQENFQNNDARQPAQGNSQNDNEPQAMQRNFQENGNPHAMQGNFDRTKFDNRGGDRRGGMSFLFPVFGLIRLAVLGLLLWLGYKLVKNSGWRLTRVQASPAPAAVETPSVVVEEKKESE
jgi:hypothetical protein